MIEFTVNIKPMGAVRMTQRSKWEDSRAKQYLAYKGVIGLEARRHIKDPFTGPVQAIITFFYPIPKGWSKKDKEQARNGKITPIVKPDLDNCVKGIYDSLNKIAWKDDNLVISTLARKLYSDEPRIEIKIWEVEAA